MCISILRFLYSLCSPVIWHKAMAILADYMSAPMLADVRDGAVLAHLGFGVFCFVLKGHLTAFKPRSVCLVEAKLV